MRVAKRRHDGAILGGREIVAFFVGFVTERSGDVLRTKRLDALRLLARVVVVVGIDVTRAEEAFGFMASTSFRDGLTRTISWYRENG